MLTQYCNSKSRGRRYRYRLWRREKKLMWRWHVWELVLNGLPNQIISGQNQVFKANLFIIQNKLGQDLWLKFFMCEFKSEYRVIGSVHMFFKGRGYCYIYVFGVSSHELFQNGSCSYFVFNSSIFVQISGSCVGFFLLGT